MASPGPNLTAVLEASTIEALRARTHDVIVVGAGAAGGFAAMLLAEAGMRVLVLDAGLPAGAVRAPVRLAGSLARLSIPRSLRYLSRVLLPLTRRAVRILGHWRQPVQMRCFVWGQAPEVFVDDHDCPYVADRDHPFVWIRARTLGGRVAVPGHGRQYYRLGPDDFAPSDQLSPRWPLQMGELDGWYSLVERRLGLSGMPRHGLPGCRTVSFPEFLSRRALKRRSKKIVERWAERTTDFDLLCTAARGA